MAQLLTGDWCETLNSQRSFVAEMRRFGRPHELADSIVIAGKKARTSTVSFWQAAEIGPFANRGTIP